MAWSGAGAWASVSGRRMRLIWSATMSPSKVTASTSANPGAHRVATVGKEKWCG